MHYKDGWKLYTDITGEARRMGIDFATSTMFTAFDNSNYQLCQTYPRKLIMPKKVSDRKVYGAAQFRSKNRLPALSYYDQRTGCSIWRCSQTNTGLFGKNSAEDEDLFYEISRCGKEGQQRNKCIIFDARPKLSAQGNKFKGGGFEDLRNYRNASLEFCDIDNIHDVREAFKKMSKIKTNQQNFNNVAMYHTAIESSGYNVLLCRILRATNMVIEAIRVQNANVLVHCSDGWDRTAQMCSLAQQCLDPYYRTIEGLCVLIEKDWCSFGHQFNLRYGQYDHCHDEK
jgi:myotubularin-related protein 6/7/8